MLIITDSIKEGMQYSGLTPEKFDVLKKNTVHDELAPGDFLEEIFGSKRLFFAINESEKFWNLLCITEHSPHSQYDIICRRMTSNLPLPDRTQLLALEGEKFHGQRGRPWQALRGNVHLSCFLRPDADASQVKLGFSMLPAKAVIETIGQIPHLEGKASVKWVNDIFIGNAKVSGFLAATRLSGMKFSEVALGIGLNVETNPSSEPTEYVPGSAALNDFLENDSKVKAHKIFAILSGFIKENYLSLTSGAYDELLEFYRSKCYFIGRTGILTADEPDGTNHEIARGKIEGIGDNMELIIDGNPFSRGRLIIFK